MRSMLNIITDWKSYWAFQDGRIVTVWSDLCRVKLIFKKRERVHSQDKAAGELWWEILPEQWRWSRPMQKEQKHNRRPANLDPGRRTSALASQVRGDSTGPWCCWYNGRDSLWNCFWSCTLNSRWPIAQRWGKKDGMSLSLPLYLATAETYGQLGEGSRCHLWTQAGAAAVPVACISCPATGEEEEPPLQGEVSPVELSIPPSTIKKAMGLQQTSTLCASKPQI